MICYIYLNKGVKSILLLKKVAIHFKHVETCATSGRKGIGNEGEGVSRMPFCLEGRERGMPDTLLPGLNGFRGDSPKPPIHPLPSLPWYQESSAFILRDMRPLAQVIPMF